VTVDIARSPLGHRADDLARLSQTTAGAIDAVEVAFPAQVDLRVDPAHVGSMPFRLPLEPNTWLTDGGRDVLWLGPDEWLVVGAPWSATTIAGELDAALSGVHRSVVDVSAARAVLDLRGAAVAELLAAGCSLDLHPRSWRAGMCAQTLLARAQVLLQQREGATRVFVRPSFAGYLLDWLLDASAGFHG
jgi:sarcosine oxidase subunit gamma